MTQLVGAQRAADSASRGVYGRTEIDHRGTVAHLITQGRVERDGAETAFADATQPIDEPDESARSVSTERSADRS